MRVGVGLVVAMVGGGLGDVGISVEDVYMYRKTWYDIAGITLCLLELNHSQ